MTTFRMEEEILRCNPKFHGKPRYDPCLVHLPNGRYIFARLRMIFECKALNRTWRLARVTFFQTHTPDARNNLRLLQEDDAGGFIDLSWIVRSVYMSPTYDPDTEHRLFFASDAPDRSGDLLARYVALENVIH